MEQPAEPEAESGSPFAAMDPEMAANPQPMFKMLREATPVMAIDGVGVVLTGRAEVDETLRHPEIFSSNMSAVDLGNIRPLIPLQIDPPEHKKYRRILDPIFAPKQMALLEEPVTRLVNDLIDSFIDRGELDFATEFSVPFPSQVFLTLLGLPLEELPQFLAMKDGIIRPDHVTGSDWNSPEMLDHQRATAASIYDYFDSVLDEREVERRDDILSLFLDSEVDGHRLSREEILDICFLFLIAGLDTVTATLDCMFSYLAQHADQRQRIVDDPSIIPTVVEELLRWETPVMGVVRVALEDTELGGCPVHKGDQVMVHARLGQHRRGRVRRRRRGALRPRGEPPHRLRGRGAPVPGLAPGPPGAAHRAARVASPHPRLLGTPRRHPRVHRGHPLDRALPHAVHRRPLTGVRASGTCLRRPAPGRR